MKVLITGATGLVGTALTNQLRQGGVPVHYLTTRKEKIRSEPDYQGFYWDPSRKIIDRECFEGVTAVVNLAGATIASRWTTAYKKKIQQSRADSLKTLHKGLANHESHTVAYLLSASAIGIYESSLTEYHTETSERMEPGFLGETVRQWESAARTFDQLGIPQGVFRIGIVLAGNGGALPQIIRPVRMGVGAPLGSGEQWQSWIHLEDLARMLRFALDERLGGIYNAVAPNPVTNRKLTQEVARILRKPLFLPAVPAWALRMVLGEMAQLVLASQRVSSEKIELEGFGFKYHNVHQALEDLLQ